MSPAKIFEQTILIPFLEVTAAADLFKDEYKDILEKYCQHHNIDYSEAITPNSTVSKQLKDRLRQIRSRKCKKSPIKAAKSKIVKKKTVDPKVETKCQELLNKTHKITFDSEAQLDKLSEVSEQLPREIKHFAYGIRPNNEKLSENVLNTLNFARKLQLYLDNYSSDYQHYLEYGTNSVEEYNYIDSEGVSHQDVRNRKKFISIEVKNDIDELMEELKNTESTYKQELLGQKFDRLNKFYKFYKNFEKEELYVFTSAAETQFNLQKAVNGSILNEIAMIENKMIQTENETATEDLPAALRDLYNIDDGKPKVFQAINESKK